MTVTRKMVRAQISALGDDEVEVVMSTDALARDGHVLIPSGCVLDNYRANPIFLWSHDPDKPIGNAENVKVGPDQITATIRFAPMGISHKADEIRGLMKTGVIRAVSVGFEPIDMEPLDPKKPRGGQRITAWELLELSAVSVPADPGAKVTARANGDNDMPEPTDPAAPPTAPVAAPDVRTRVAIIGTERGLYQVAQLCYLFEELGWQVDMAKYESSIEGDASAVPGMLAGVLHDLGDTLLAMTQEEIAEALAGYDVEPEEDAGDILVSVDDRAHIRAATSPRIRALRRRIAQIRAGKALSADNVRCLRDAIALHQEGITEHRSGIAKQKKGIGLINDMLDRAGVSDTADDASQTVQGSDGTDVSDGAENGRSFEFRRRQAALLALGAA